MGVGHVKLRRELVFGAGADGQILLGKVDLDIRRSGAVLDGEGVLGAAVPGARHPNAEVFLIVRQWWRDLGQHPRGERAGLEVAVLDDGCWSRTRSGGFYRYGDGCLNGGGRRRCGENTGTSATEPCWWVGRCGEIPLCFRGRDGGSASLSAETR